MMYCVSLGMKRLSQGVLMGRHGLSSPIISANVTRSRLLSSSPFSRHLDGSSAVYLEQMHDAWKKDPSSVHVSWASYFKNVEAGISPPLVAPPNLFPTSPVVEPSVAAAGVAGGISTEAMKDQLNLWSLIRAYRVRGHHAANLDPLGRARPFPIPQELSIEAHGFTDRDLDRVIPLNGNTLPLRQVLEDLKSTYCGTIGLEFMQVPNAEQVTWLQSKLEGYNKVRKSTTTPQRITLDRLMWADMYERFLEIKFAGAKRFGLEGCESVIPALKALVDRAADLGVENMVFGMPHRGRLNFLSNVMRKPHEQIFCEFFGTSRHKTGSGDVKYHLGASVDRETNSGKRVHLSLVANPSHLEAVNPVVEGKTRAKQHYSEDKTRDKSMSVVMHGDAAFSGQGIVYETLHLNDLPSYTTGGTIHVIVNNQIGFTTDPVCSRSTPYPTDVAKSLGCPILHVNGDDTDAVTWAAELAAEFRQKFHKSFILDIVGYRKHGHNEVDAPEMTQPLMYDMIGKHPSVLSLYVKKMIDAGVITEEEYQKERKRITADLEAKLELAKSKTPSTSAEGWTDSNTWEVLPTLQKTGVPVSILKHVGEKISHVPADFNIHKTVGRVMKKKAETIKAGEGIDWATAEALAFGTLLLEGNHVRLSGQDVERGTFSHRHAVLHDQVNGNRYIPLSLIEQESPRSAKFSVYNSSLSEFGVLGFELGFSMENPKSLVLWEAQFGDFANGAQIMFDQFIASGEEKWMRQNGLVCLLPHGYDGQGPEHSSARLERFLQMSDSNPEVRSTSDDPEIQIANSNWQIANVTTPANYFHLLRRQVHRSFRKPLIVMSPKNLLRHPDCVSNLSDFDDVPDESNGQDLFFKRVIGEVTPIADPASVKRVIFCSGKVYYDLVALRSKLAVKNVAIVRVEQIAPFPDLLVEQHANLYPNAEIAWCQEEPMNMGAFSFVAPHFRTIFAPSRGSSFKVTYFGRLPAASPSTGYLAVHNHEQNRLCTDALTL